MSGEKIISAAPSDLLVAKIVATPTSTVWSQAYNAGGLFAVLSLEGNPDEDQKDSLPILGKEVINSLEAEYFSLEEKKLETIKQSVSTASNLIPEGISCSIVVGAIPPGKNILYIFLNKGIVSVKRGEKFGRLLSSEEGTEINSASGFLENDDVIVLQTIQFSKLIPEETLISSMDHLPPSEIAETLSPKIHETEEGGATALIFRFASSRPEENTEEESEIIQPPTPQLTAEEISEDKKTNFSPAGFLTNLNFSKYLKFGFPSLKTLNHSKKVFLSLALLIVVILALSIFFAVKKQNDSKTETLFTQIQSAAQKKYDEGLALSELNKSLAQDDFAEAKKILEEGKPKFGSNSKEEKQITDLLAKVQNEISKNSPSTGTTNLDRGKITLVVKNGSGTEGVAGKASDLLKGLGYKVAASENADNYNYKGVTIRVKDSIKNYLDMLKKDLSAKYTITASTSDLPESTSSDGFVIIGK